MFELLIRSSKDFKPPPWKPFLSPQNSHLSFPEAEFQQSTMETPLRNGFRTDLGSVEGALAGGRAISVTTQLPRGRTNASDSLRWEMPCQAPSPVLTLSPNLPGSHFSCGFIPRICCAYCRGPLAFGIPTQFNELIWCVVFSVFSLADDRVNS